MDELAWAMYCKREKEAREVYLAIREIYGFEHPWSEVYFMAIKDKMLSRKEKDIVKEFYPIKFRR